METYSCQLAAQKALPLGETRPGLHSAAPCGSGTDGRTRTFLEDNREREIIVTTVYISNCLLLFEAKFIVEHRCRKCKCVYGGAHTLPPAVAQLAEAAPLTQAVEPLLLDQLQDFRLDPLTQFTGGSSAKLAPSPHTTLSISHTTSNKRADALNRHVLGFSRCSRARVPSREYACAVGLT